MSGGYFDYNQFFIGEIETTLEEFLEKSECENRGGYEEFEDKFVEHCKVALHILKIARVYTHRIDWVLSGDDSEDVFYKRLEEDLKGVESGMFLQTAVI